PGQQGVDRIGAEPFARAPTRLASARVDPEQAAARGRDPEGSAGIFRDRHDARPERFHDRETPGARVPAREQPVVRPRPEAPAAVRENGPHEFIREAVPAAVERDAVFLQAVEAAPFGAGPDAPLAVFQERQDGFLAERFRLLEPAGPVAAQAEEA